MTFGAVLNCTFSKWSVTRALLVSVLDIIMKISVMKAYTHYACALSSFTSNCVFKKSSYTSRIKRLNELYNPAIYILHMVQLGSLIFLSLYFQLKATKQYKSIIFFYVVFILYFISTFTCTNRSLPAPAPLLHWLGKRIFYIFPGSIMFKSFLVL